jgi:hypothetical protein
MASTAYSLNGNGIPRFEDLPLGKGDPLHSAWGLYGKNDELGTLNRLTGERVVEAAKAEIQSGVRLVILVAMLSVRSVYSPWIVLRKRVGIRPLLIDKLSSIPIPQDGAIAPEGFVLLPIVDPFINIMINYQYNDQLSI